MSGVTEPEALAWWVRWCATEGHDPATATATVLADAVLDALNDGWSGWQLEAVVEAVGELTGLWRTPAWAMLRLGLPA